MAESKAKSKGELPCPEMARWQGPCALASHSCAMGPARAGVGRTLVHQLIMSLVKTLDPASRVFILSKLLESCFTMSIIRRGREILSVVPGPI